MVFTNSRLSEGTILGAHFGSILGLRAAGPGPGMGWEILGAGSAVNWNFVIHECPVPVVKLLFPVDREKSASIVNAPRGFWRPWSVARNHQKPIENHRFWRGRETSKGIDE